MPRRPSIDWKRIKTDYIFGITQDGQTHFPTYSELSKKYGVPLNTIAIKGAEESWAAEREIRQNKAQERMLERHQQRINDEQVDFDKKAYNFAKAALSIANSKLIKTTPDGRKTLNDELDSLSLKRLSETVETIHRMGKNALQQMDNNESSIDKLVEMFSVYWNTEDDEENSKAISVANMIDIDGV